MEATSHKQHITGKNEDHATTESSEPKDSDNNGAGDNDAGDPGRPQHNHASTSRADEALHVAFLGLEFVLFAPLFFLLLRSLTQYIVDLSMNDCAVSLRGNVGGLINGDSVIQKRKEIGKQSLFDAKALSVGLLFAIVATHLVGGLLSSKYEEGRTADRLEIVVGLCLLVFLGLTYLSMELISHRDRGDKRQ